MGKRVTIWDLDYYYCKDKVNKFNPDVMKISSYHKQLGDSVNFVMNEFDIHRPYDLYYIIKEDKKTPNPPMNFFVNNKIRWWGEAVKYRVKWKMPQEMMACRPDYLLYPEKETKMERAEHLRFFDNKGNPLPRIQDWKNTFKNKMVIVTDKNFWNKKNNDNDIIEALKMLQQMKNVMFLEPISIQKILSNKIIRENFLKIKFTKGTDFNWSEVQQEEFEAALKLMAELKEANPSVKIGSFIFNYSNKNSLDHWMDKRNALRDFAIIRDAIKAAKDIKIAIKILMPPTRFNTPYFELFEEIARWTNENFSLSWLEYITKKFAKNKVDLEDYWNNPYLWNEVYRDLLLQTYKYHDFLLQKMGSKYVSDALIPWEKWKEEFRYEI